MKRGEREDKATEQGGGKYLGAVVPLELHRRIRTAAINNDRPVYDVVRESLEQWLEREERAGAAAPCARA